jgi:hypothetical protein
MNTSGALVGSTIGAIIGCAAWVGVGYATGYELGILAVGVGIAVGIGAAIGAKGRAGTSGGIVAALVAIAAIVTARYVLVQIAIEREIAQAREAFGNEIPGPEDDAYWTGFIADRIVKQREDAGQTIDWSSVAGDDDDEDVAARYPADIWMEAQRQWKGIPTSQRGEFCAAATQTLITGDEHDFRTVASIIGVLISNLHPMALVIMGIAAAGAFRVARNSRPANEDLAVEFGGMTDAPAIAGAVANANGAPVLQPTNVNPSTPAPAARPAKAPPRRAQADMPAAFDESQLPPQFRMKQETPAPTSSRGSARRNAA